MPALPKKINILGIPYAVKVCAENFTSPDSHFGEIRYTDTSIRINSAMSEPMQIQTLIHEWVHGALVLLGHNEEADDEKLVQGLALAINQTFTLK